MEIKLSGLLDSKMWEMSEEAKERARQHIRDCYEKYESGMLTYEGEKPIIVHAPRVEMMPSPRKGFFGRIKDRIFGPVKKPQAVMVLDKEAQERLRKQLEDLCRNDLAACAVSAEDIKEATDRIITLARGHHVRNADGTVTDVSNNPNYECK